MPVVPFWARMLLQSAPLVITVWLPEIWDGAETFRCCGMGKLLQCLMGRSL